MDKKELQKRVDDLADDGQWNCYFEFPNGVKTRTKHIDSPGYNINKWKRLKPIIQKLDVSDKTIIDVGCGDGYYSIQCAKEGAKYVLGSDIDEKRISRGKLAKDVYQLTNVDFDTVDLYEDEIKQFDIVMGLGLLHRIPNIDDCLKKMCEIGKYVLLEFKTFDDPRPIIKTQSGKSKSNKFNKLYGTPTISYISQKMGEFNFSCLEVWKDKSNLNFKRTIMLFRKGV